jgi:peptidoglycan/xylan/chitin deacetylase (PgdA/CDA1 family)
MNLPIRVPLFIQWCFPNRVWRINTKQKKLYLTFDDGPHPEITPMVLQLLNAFHAKASFFCIGKRVESYPHVVQEILQQGSIVGNHSYSHLNGWKTSTSTYLADVDQAKTLIDSTLFRAPYGRMKNSQAVGLTEKGFQLVMWTVLSQDYDSRLTPLECSERSVKNLKSGDIILFHDSVKAKENMLAGVEAVLKWGSENGYEFEVLDLKPMRL